MSRMLDTCHTTDPVRQSTIGSNHRCVEATVSEYNKINPGMAKLHVIDQLTQLNSVDDSFGFLLRLHCDFHTIDAVPQRLHVPVCWVDEPSVSAGPAVAGVLAPWVFLAPRRRPRLRFSTFLASRWRDVQTS